MDGALSRFSRCNEFDVRYIAMTCGEWQWLRCLGIEWCMCMTSMHACSCVRVAHLCCEPWGVCRVTNWPRCREAGEFELSLQGVHCREHWGGAGENDEACSSCAPPLLPYMHACTLMMSILLIQRDATKQ